MAVIVHDLHAETCRIEACQPCQIHRGLRMACPAQHAALHSPQGEHMAGTAEAGSLGGGVQKLLDGLAAFKGGNARIRIKGINGHGESRLVIVRIVHHHLADVQLVQALAVNRSADETLGEFRHEVDILGSHSSGGHYEVPLILPVLIIHYHYHLAMLDVLDGLFHRGKFILVISSLFRHIFRLLSYLKIHSAIKTPG